MTNSTNATAPATSSYTKDAVPPEPLPPSLTADQQMYSRNQHQNNGQVVLSSTPSTSTVNSTVTVESKPSSNANTTTTAAGYSSFSSQQTTTTLSQPNLSPIPPQPIPTALYNSSTECQLTAENAAIETPKPIEEKPTLTTNLTNESSALGEEHPIERVENTRPSSSTVADTDTSEVNEEFVQENVDDKSTDQPENPNETESFENELEDLQPPAAPRMITANYEEDEEEYESDIRPNDEAETLKASIDDDVAEQPTEPIQGTKEEAVVEQPKEVIQKHKEPLVEVKPEIERQPSKEFSIQPPTLNEPSTSLMEEKMEVLESSKEEMPIEDEAPEESMEFEEEETPVKMPKSQPKKKAKSRPPAKSRKSAGSNQSRKRKKAESEEEQDENTDNEFVPEAPSK